MASEVTWVGLAASLVLVALAVGLSLRQRLGLEKPILLASARAAAQLLAVGWVLVVILDPDAPIALSWAWVVFMVLFAAVTIHRRARDVPSSFWLGLVAMSVVVVVSLGVVFGLGIFPVVPEAIVPIAGMMIGNSMSETVLVANRVVGEVGDKRTEVEARLALGLPSHQAGAPYVRQALRTALIPQIERTKSVGLVILPGAMTGLILAGVDPLDAVRVQLAIMYLILGSVATCVTVVGVGLGRRLFTADHRLVPLPGRDGGDR